MLTRWKDVLLGGAAFLAAHAVEVWAWRTWFAPAGDFAAWFLNSGRAVAFTAACLFVVSAISVFLRRGGCSDDGRPVRHRTGHDLADRTRRWRSDRHNERCVRLALRLGGAADDLGPDS
jgi:hypothetical protein